MSAFLEVYRRLSPLLALALIPLAFLLVVQKGETRHWHKLSDNFEKLYHGEQIAHQQTEINYRRAAEQARQADKANLDRVVAEQKAINQKTEQSYEARIAAARAESERLRRQGSGAGSNPGSPGTAPVPTVPGSAGGAGPTTPQAQLPPDDALIATEQAIQLDELIRWVNRQLGIDMNGEEK